MSATKMVTVNSGPHKKLNFIGHVDAEAYDKEAGAVGECVTTADLSDIYRSLLPASHDRFATVLAKSGVTRGVNQKATEAARERAKLENRDKVEAVAEAYVPYANRVKLLLEAGKAGGELNDGSEEAIATGKALWASLDAEIHAIAETIACDASPSAREKGPDKGALAKADDILSRDDAGIETAVTKLLNVVEGYDLERDEAGKPERLSLARLVQEFLKQSL